MKKTSLNLSDFEILRSISQNSLLRGIDRTIAARLSQRELLAWVWGRFELTPRGERFLEILNSLTPSILSERPERHAGQPLNTPIFANASRY